MDSNEPFTVKRITIFKTLLLAPAKGWPVWAAFFIGLLLTTAGCFIDLRFLLFGLIIWLTVVPMIALFQFVNFMLGSEMVANLLHHTIERRNSSYLIHIFRPADKSNPIEADKSWVESGRLTVFDTSVVKKSYTNDYEVLFLKDAPLSVLYLPRY